jgi:hypothetical protein
MKFDAKYPDKTNALKLNPDKLMGPHKEVVVTSEVMQSWRVFPCGACGALTGWRFSAPNADYPPSPACSEECVEALKANIELPSSDSLPLSEDTV